MRDSMRRLLIDRLLTERKIVTFEELTTLLKASAPTVKRDLRYMREILGAPIVYSRVLGGYSYDPGLKIRCVRMANFRRLEWVGKRGIHRKSCLFSLR